MDASFPLPVFTENAPLYDQLYRHIAGAIQSGALSPGARLPSKRRMCALAGVSMSTVETAYSLLAAEGYVLAKPRSGYVCARLLPPAPAAPASLPAAPPDPPRWAYDCSTSAVDTSVFPFSSWARITKEAVYENPGLLQRGHPQGDQPLRAALTQLLSQYRGVRCTPEQVVVGAGADYLLSLLLQLLPEQQAVALEDPGYPAAYAAAALHGRQAVPIPVDGEGMDRTALERSGAGLAYVTPSHQFPLGVTMPAARRSQLLHWAAARPGRFLIEDDYDSEFRWSSRPIPAVQGMDRAGRVVYMGTFSRSIAPAIRVAYMILPPALLERFRATFSHGACTVSRFEQESLRRFLVQGLYGRHLRRAGNLYRKKCALFAGALAGIPGAVLSGADAGLHFLLTLPRYSEEELVARAAEKSIRVHPLSRYCHAVPPQPSTVVLGFAGLTEGEIGRAAELLREAWK
ncbi:MAG: PLP-dependent aminotransferase family protein [Oscillospiraceae bacterium]|nr:PLP-dependent aminotransferase family protein [Oscillospiraceae bacterium]